MSENPEVVRQPQVETASHHGGGGGTGEGEVAGSRKEERFMVVDLTDTLFARILNARS